MYIPMMGRRLTLEHPTATYGAQCQRVISGNNKDQFLLIEEVCRRQHQILLFKFDAKKPA